LRRGAQQAGELQTAELLEELERVLLEVAHSSETMTPEEATALRARIREQGLLFRVRLLENKNKQNTELTD
jgi:cytosine/adenosine deaminase-related metal-dependent hydrolase